MAGMRACTPAIAMTTEVRPVPEILLRPIATEDNAAVAAVIRDVMPSFGACGPGFALSDPEVEHMAEAYAAPRSAYFVVEIDGRVVGGAGIAPLAGAAADVCELRKMYYLPEARGLGLGDRMLRLCLATARDLGFKRCYLETLSGMDAAMRLYEKLGFCKLCGPLGDTGHFGCDRHYALDL
jgi:putative acetyltransferase